MESVFVVTAVIGVTELIKRAQAKDQAGSLVIVCAAVIGAVAGYFGVEGLTVVSGIVAGLSAAGIITTAQKV